MNVGLFDFISLSISTFLGGLGIGVGVTQAQANAALKENENKIGTVDILKSNAEISELKESIGALNAQVEFLKEYVEELKKINAEDAKTIESHLKTIESLGIAVNLSTETNAVWVKTAQEYKDKIEELTNTLSKEYENSAKLQEALENIKSQYDKIQGSENSLKEKVDELQQTIKDLTEQLLSQGQKPENPKTPTIESFAESFNNILNVEYNEDSDAFYDTQIRRLASEAELAYLSGDLSHDEVLSLFESVKLKLEPNFYDRNDIHNYLAEILDDKQFDILYNHLSENVSEIENKNNGLSLEYFVNGLVNGQFVKSEYNSEKVIYVKDGNDIIYGQQDKSGSVQASHNDNYLAFDANSNSTNQNTSSNGDQTAEIESISSSLLKTFLNIDPSSFLGEATEFLHYSDYRDVISLGNGAYSIKVTMKDGGTETEISCVYTPNDHGGYDLNLSANENGQNAGYNFIWGEVSQKEFEEMKAQVLSEIEKSKTNNSSLGE